MGRLFGTDGVRGIANTELTCTRAFEIGRAAAAVLTEGCRRRPVFVVGGDTRASTGMLSCAISAGLCSVGADVIDLGVDVAPEKFAETAKNEGCNLVCCSALLTTTMPVMEKVVVALKEAGVRDQVTVLVGGAPVTQEFCDQIGADIYTADGASCANKAAEVLTA